MLLRVHKTTLKVATYFKENVKIFPVDRYTAISSEKCVKILEIFTFSYYFQMTT